MVSVSGQEKLLVQSGLELLLKRLAQLLDLVTG